MSENLIYSRILRPRGGQLWRYYLPDILTSIPRVIKYSWQRARRGWADCDTWGVDTWFLKVVPDMLDRLVEHHQAFPIEFAYPSASVGDNTEFTEDNYNESGSENWSNTLRKMAHDLRALQRYDDRWFGGDEPLYSTEKRNECTKEETDAYNKVKAGLLSFYEWFFSLCD